jgi:hypothetical protein
MRATCSRDLPREELVVPACWDVGAKCHKIPYPGDAKLGDTNQVVGAGLTSNGCHALRHGCETLV